MLKERKMGARKTEEIVRELADLEAIRDLARRYAHCVWQKDVPGAIDLFAEDAVMDMGDRPPIEGRAALLEVYQATFDASTFKPFVHNHVIEIDGDEARGTVYLDLRSINEEDKPMTGHGFYHDRYRRVGDQWKFARRELVIENLTEV
jgi:ketosteroid isomerase-like protein